MALISWLRLKVISSKSSLWDYSRLMLSFYDPVISKMSEKRFFPSHCLFSYPFISNGQILLPSPITFKEIGRREHLCRTAFHPWLWNFWCVPEFYDHINPLLAWKSKVPNVSALSSALRRTAFLQFKSLSIKQVFSMGSTGCLQAKASIGIIQEKFLKSAMNLAARRSKQAHRKIIELLRLEKTFRSSSPTLN